MDTEHSFNPSDMKSGQKEAQEINIVGIGASAGGLNSLRPLISKLKKNGIAAYIVAQHSSPKYKSVLSEILQRHTSLSVVKASDNDHIINDTIYVIPENRNARIINGFIILSEPEFETHPSPSINMLFESMAEYAGEKAIGIILSGTGRDGTDGAKAIRFKGGKVIIQKHEEANHDDMALSAIEAEAVDFEMKISDIGNYINSLRDHQKEKKQCMKNLLPEQNQLKNQDFKESEYECMLKILSIIKDETLLDVNQYKEGTLKRQIEKRYKGLKLGSALEYLKYMENNKKELESLKQSFLISVTSFFRDEEPFKALEKALRDIISKKAPGDSIRIWTPGCASGQEAYSVAILINEILGDQIEKFEVRIFATDIDNESIERARQGIFQSNSMLNVQNEILEKYFIQEKMNYKISKQIREICVFSIHDVIRHPPFIRMDMVCCRNLMIYLKAQQQDVLFSNFSYSLNPAGYLMLGKSESIGSASRLFEAVDSKNKLFRRKASAVACPIRTSGFSSMTLSPSTPPIKPRIESRSLVDLTRDALVNNYGPPSILVNQSFEILHFFGNARDFMQIPKGEPDFSLFSICIPELRIELKTLCYRISQEDLSYLTGIPTRICINDRTLIIRIVIRKISLNNPAEGCGFLISFEDHSPLQEIENLSVLTSTEISEIAAEEISRLQHELSETREHLQTLIEALEASNEELQSLNEELQSSSEELQSSNEELQSSNEELTTLNEELRVKSTEITDINTILSNIQDSIRMGLIVVDAESRITRFNALSVRIFGLMQTDIGSQIYGVPCHLNIPNLKKQITAVISSGKSVIERVCKNDNHYLMQLAPYLDESGRRTGVILTFTDLSELQATEAALRESEERFKAFMDNSQAASWMKDEEGRYVYLNKMFEEHFGVSIEDWKGKTDLEVWPEKIASTLTQNDRYVITSGIAMQIVEEKVNPDGKISHWLDSKFPFTDSGGKKYVGGIGLDISERLETEIELKKLFCAVEQSPVTIVITDDKGTIEYVNPAFEISSGYQRSEVIGQNPRILMSEEHESDFFSDLWKTISNGMIWEGRITNKKKDQSLFYQDTIISPIRDSSGNLTNYVAVQHDVTEQLKLNEEKNKLMAQFHQAQKMESIGRLAGGVAHDFNNMLGAIVGYAELAMSDLSNQNQIRHDLEEILKAAERSTSLVKQLLAFARKQTAQPRITDINLAISGMLKMLGRIIGEDIDLIWRPGKDIWKVKIDPSQIDQLLTNLAVNARDAISGVGKLIIETKNSAIDENFCKIYPEASPGYYIMISVEDNGKGMDKKNLASIFEPFFSTKEIGKGTGLGLATVYGIVKQNSGFILVASEPSKGTVFSVFLPRLIQSDNDIKIEKRNEEEEISGGDETILLVEDEKSIMNLGRVILEKLGYTVISASSPEDGIRKAESHKGNIDLVISDVVMPGMNGKQLVEILSARFNNIKYIFMSGYTSDIISDRGIISEEVNFLQKPFFMRELASKVRQALE